MNEYFKEIEKQLEIMGQANAQFIEDWNYMNSKDFKFEMVKNKYYWTLIKETSLTGELTREMVGTVHPFTWRQKVNPQLPDLSILILNWKEITKEEYELYQTT